MFTINTFIEVQIVGLLLLLALSPVALAVARRYHDRPGFCPPIDGLQTNSAHAVLLVVAAFTLGVAGNRLADELFDDVLHVEGKEWYQQAYRCARVTPPGRAVERSVPACDAAMRGVGLSSASISADVDGGLPRTFKRAEYQRADSSDSAAEYFGRHKLFMRVERGAAIAAMLLVVSMLGYDLSRLRRGAAMPWRYPVGAYVAASVAAVAFFVAYRFESTHFYERVCEVATSVDGCRLFGADAPDALRGRGLWASVALAGVCALLVAAAGAVHRRLGPPPAAPAPRPAEPAMTTLAIVRLAPTAADASPANGAAPLAPTVAGRDRG